MKTIIAGTRTVTDMWALDRAMKFCGWTPTEVISGCAKGPDSWGELWAEYHRIPVRRFPVFPSDWRKNKNAGIKRNVEMAKVAQALVAIWDGQSRGTARMIREAQKRGLRVYIYNVIRKTGLDATWTEDFARECMEAGYNAAQVDVMNWARSGADFSNASNMV